LSNLFNSKNEKPLPPGVEFYILDHDGIRFGFMGLIEYDWVLTQNTIKPCDYIYQDFIIKAKSLVQFFKSQNCDIIIALTHMRNYNDMYLIK
jgi:2',3'-cyclic-nucleotide 2'-phosphodiesterase (5'-nucleotidase family)